ncbi:MAG: hypothetical protein DKM24_01085 [Candidatus Melainabacteria bacterium]|nr:MAG: hypothetical protein DKM24_01085 [Candidatus Melainabacteria bacterium]
MVRIDKAQREVNTQAIPHQYVDGGNTRGAFGENVALATEKAGEGLEDIGIMLDKIQAQNERANVVKLQNDVYQQWEEPNLYSKDGYFNQFGRNAAGKSAEVLANYDAWVEQRKKELGINSKRANVVFAEMNNRNRERISRAILAHDLQQTQEAEKTELSQLCKNYDTQGVWDRNSDEQFEYNLSEKIKAVKNYGVVANLDKTQIKALIDKSNDEYLNGVLTALLTDGNYQRASVILENNKSLLTPDNYIKFTKEIKNFSDEDFARQFATDLINKGYTVEQAQNLIDQETNFEMWQKKNNLYHNLYNTKKHNEETVQNEILTNEFNNLLSGKYDIATYTPPNSLEPINQQKLIKMKQDLLEGGGIKTDPRVYAGFSMAMLTNAEEFSKINFDLYQNVLEPKDILKFKQAQERIRQHGYSSVTPDDEFILNAAKQYGWFTDKNAMASAIEASIQTEEARYGKQYSKDDLRQRGEKYASYYGLRGNKNERSALDVINDNMSKEFMVRVQQGLKAYENKHGINSMTPEQFRTMVNRIAGETKTKGVQLKYETLRKTNIQSQIKESPNLINFRHSEIPDIEKALGFKLNISSTTREPNGSYKSKHSEGLAMDIGYTLANGRKMSTQQKLTLVGRTLASNNVAKIAISSADPDGKMIMQAYGKRFASKIQDMNQKDANGKTRDQNLNTNHTNHLHITFKAGQQNPQVKEGTIIKNKQSGERMILKGGIWQAI